LLVAVLIVVACGSEATTTTIKAATTITQAVTTTSEAATTTTQAVTTTSEAATTTTQAGVASALDVVYGSNKDYTGTTETLKLDVYFPPGVAQGKRPLLILLHGAGADKADVAPIARAVAQQGIVVAGINHRSGGGNETLSDAQVKTIGVQVAQDARAAVRFFRNLANADLYGVDTAKVFLGGISQGAFFSGYTVYLDDLKKADAGLRKIITANGGLEGDSGNPGYDSSVAGWVCLYGGMVDKNLITSSDVPLLAIYGTADEIVPAEDGVINVPGGAMVSGAVSLYNRAKSVGLTASQLYAVEGAGHAEVLDSPEVITAVVQFVNPGAKAVAGVSGEIVIDGLVPEMVKVGPLTLDALKMMDPHTISAEHPETGVHEYRGVFFSNLIPTLQLDKTATTMAITGFDGTTVEVPLTQLEAAKDALIAFGDGGRLNAVMPGMAAKYWVENMVRLEFK
jgi:predicted esterase